MGYSALTSPNSAARHFAARDRIAPLLEGSTSALERSPVLGTRRADRLDSHLFGGLSADTESAQLHVFFNAKS